MKIPAGFQLREGDVVTVKAKVRFDLEKGDDRVHIRFDNYRDIAVPLADVLSIESREWKGGDYVRNVNDHSDHGEVVAFREGMAWVKLSSGAFTTYASLDLEMFAKPETPES